VHEVLHGMAGFDQEQELQGLQRSPGHRILHHTRTGYSALDPDWIRIRILIRNSDPDPGGQKRPTKIEEMKKFHVLKC
jgi:hypothetical protein